MKKLLSIALAALLLQSCADTRDEEPESEAPMEQSRLAQVSWLLGPWQLETPDGILSESWTAISDNEYSGFSMMVSAKGDTLFSEKLRLVSKGDTLWYMPTVSNQNDGKEVSFKEKEITAHKLVFENMEHDFPQRIVYERTSDSTLLAYIEGAQNGEYRKEEFPYKKK